MLAQQRGDKRITNSAEGRSENAEVRQRLAADTVRAHLCSTHVKLLKGWQLGQRDGCDVLAVRDVELD